MNSFDKLLELAGRSGDKLIIYDKISQKHQVVLPIEQYESMLDGGVSHTQDTIPVESLTEIELIEKINEDIALWRAHQNKEEDMLFDDVDFNETVPNGHMWHSTGDVIEQKRAHVSGQPTHEEIINFFSKGDESEESDFFADENDDFEPPMFVEEKMVGEEKQEKTESHVVYDPIMETSGPIPPQESEMETPAISTEEALEDDEPIFFEEPV